LSYWFCQIGKKQTSLSESRKVYKLRKVKSVEYMDLKFTKNPFELKNKIIHLKPERDSSSPQQLTL